MDIIKKLGGIITETTKEKKDSKPSIFLKKHIKIKKGDLTTEEIRMLKVMGIDVELDGIVDVNYTPQTTKNNPKQELNEFEPDKYK